ncbi:Protein gts1 [Sporothrix epigloea]|uniref:Protein gts1 n=1 Tax=Sporothrix epigloea TaxID=1892477 RepID=A0ABP0DVM5_9PEZI
MTSVPSKRQQARNEKALQELVQSVPGNNACADCKTRNPAWASWNLGIFLCMRCAAIHRKLGTHVSKVKSLSMDSWSNEQVDNMRKVGNAASNKVYNCAGRKLLFPIDADEADAAMERFIRQKYVDRAFSESIDYDRHRRIGSSGSDDTPPPLPPKTPGRFGTRSASATMPFSSKVEHDISSANNLSQYSNARGRYESGVYPPASPLPRAMFYPRSESSGSGPRIRKKISQVFGSSNNLDGSGNLKANLASLREMGFSDERRNTVVLKSVSWDLEKAVEILARMGDVGVDNGRLSPQPLTLPRESSLSAPTRTFSMPMQATNVPVASSQKVPSTPLVDGSSNPFAALDHALPSAPPQLSQSTGTLQNEKSYHAANPFGIVSTPQQLATLLAPAPTVAASVSTSNLNQAFQNMALGSPQSLFPYYTGSSVPPQQELQEVPSSSPALLADQVYRAVSPTTATQHSHLPQLSPHNNPFLNNDGWLYQPQHQQHWPQSAQTPSTSTNGNPFGSNPFTRLPTRVQSPNALGQILEQSHASYFTGLPQSQTYPLPQAPSNTSMQSLPVPASSHFPQQLPQQLPQLQQQTNNPFMTYPPTSARNPQLQHTASVMSVQGAERSTNDVTTLSDSPLLKSKTDQPPVDPALRQSAQQAGDRFLGRLLPENSSAAISASATNPFLGIVTRVDVASTSLKQQAGMPGQPFHVSYEQAQPQLPSAPSLCVTKSTNMASLITAGRSRDSMMALGMEWSNGRHSPDAFVGLSARH